MEPTFAYAVYDERPAGAHAEAAALDELRATEYRRLDARGEVYLDYTGGSVYAESQVEEPAARRRGLPVRAAGPVPGHLRQPQLGQRHRELARREGASVEYVPLDGPHLRVAEGTLDRHLDGAAAEAGNLFAYPAQSNFSGVKHPLEWIEAAHERGWDVLLDCAAFAPTSRLDLSAWQPDFIAVSFYKMFGYPTGIGALIARRHALERLRRPWFSGGTVITASVQGDLVVPHAGHARFEDGTVDYLGIPAVEIGLRHLGRIGMDAIARRVERLATWLLDRLQRLRHSDGSPMIRIYGPPAWERRGGTIAFNFLHPDGRVVDERHVDALAAERRISLRTGCFCNPGAGEAAFALSEEALRRHPVEALDDYIRLVGLPSGGAVRVSLGLASNFADVRRFMTFADGFRDLAGVPADLPPRHAC